MTRVNLQRGCRLVPGTLQILIILWLCCSRFFTIWLQGTLPIVSLSSFFCYASYRNWIFSLSPLFQSLHFQIRLFLQRPTHKVLVHGAFSDLPAPSTSCTHYNFYLHCKSLMALSISNVF